ncbi:MAG: RHS repeat protein, partial [Chitinophagaceae bacterium]
MNTTIYQIKRMLKGKMLYRLLVVALLAVNVAEAQNLNNPNKTGPLGTQVNTFSGNLFIPRADFYIPARSFSLNVRFYYNSYHFNTNTGYGRGWSFEYNIRYREDTVKGRKIIVWSDGREDRFDSLENGTYRSPRGFFDRLRQYQPGKFVLTRKDSTRYFFDNSSHRKITRMEAASGNFLQFQYTNSLLTAVANGDGQTISFTYDGRGQLSAVADATGSPVRTYTYRYDAAGNLTEVQDPAGGKWTYTYLVNGPMKTLADKNNNKIDIIYFPDMSTRELIGCNKRLSFSYDTTQKKTVVTDYMDDGANQVTTYTYQKLDNLVWITSVKGNCCGFEMQYDYDDQGNIVKQTDANGNVSTFTYDNRGNMLTATNPLGQTTTYTYSTSFNQVTSMRDVQGRVFTLKYNAAGHLIELAEPGNRVYTAEYNNRGDLLTSKDPMGNVYAYHYDSYGRPVKVTGPNGYTATLGYDDRGNLLSFVDANGNRHHAEYDILDRIKKVTNPLNRSAQFAWDAQSNLVSVTNSNNETVQLGYDASNRLVRAKGPTGNTAEVVYDAMDNIIGKKNPLGYQWQYAYDNQNRLQQVTDALGQLTNLTYDANGNLTQATLANGHTVSYMYDKMDRLLSVKDGESELAAFTYDAGGNIASAKNPAGGISTYRYDEMNRLVQATDPLGNQTVFTYDQNNKLLSSTDANGHTSQFTYDSLNRLKTYTDNNGFVMTIGYDTQGNVTSLTDQNGNRTTYAYNALNQRKSMTFPDGSYQEYGYDNKGNLVSYRLADGSIINLQYDTLSRIVGKTLPAGDLFSYRYDALGRMVEATNKNGTVKLTYDALNRITSETFDGRTTRYQYNVAGRTQTTVYPDGSAVVKEYDGRNRLLRITKDNLLIAAYDYNTGNQLTRKAFGNGVTTQLQSDFAYRLNGLSTGDGTIQNTQFAYDKVRNKTAINRLINPAHSELFTYDKGYRLTQYNRGNTVDNNYAYDAVGNRTAENSNGNNSAFTVNALNQLTAKNGVSFTYDGRGNLTFDGSFYKTYDGENRLLKDSASPTSVITYGYDAFGRRVMKTINGQTFNYSFSGLAPIEERAGNEVLNRTVFSHFLTPVMNEKSGAGRFYFHQNEANSVEAITNSNGRLVESYRYDAYGKLSRFDSVQQPLHSSLAGNRFGFTGQEWDSATGSYRFFFRNYNPETGTFNQRDLIEYGDGMGMYQYLGNNPANGIDILGLNDPCKPKPTFEQIREEQSMYLGVTQLGLDFTGNLGTTLSVIDLPRAMAEANYNAQYLKAASNYAEFGEAAFDAGGLASSGSKFSNAAAKMPGVTKTTAVLGKAGPVLGAVDMGVKGANLYQTVNDPAANSLDVIDATGDLVGSGGNLGATLATGAAAAAGSTIAAPAAVIIGTLALADAGLTAATGQGVKGHSYDLQYQLMWGSSEAEHEYYNWLETFGLEDSEFLKNIYMQGKGETYLRTIRGMGPKPPCPPGGTLDPPPGPPGGPNGWFWLIMPIDPNEIIGPDGVGEKKWVSVKQTMNYTIRCENDTAASAPARYIRFSTTIHPKHDPNTFELGSFGFNNQTFDIPQGLTSYYQRLDWRDSMGLYVDVVAGYDQMTNEAFWEFRGIDPITLLPSDDPEKGILFLQDTAQPLHGHGYVTFSIKPK